LSVVLLPGFYGLLPAVDKVDAEEEEEDEKGEEDEVVV